MLRDISSVALEDEATIILQLQERATWLDQDWDEVEDLTKILLKSMKNHLGLGAEHIMQRYRLTDPEGSALMSLAEALLRIPDEFMSKVLVQDKLSGKHWDGHESAESSHWLMLLMSVGLNIATRLVSPKWRAGLIGRFTGKVTEPLLVESIRYTVKLLGRIFVTGINITNAVDRMKSYQQKGFQASYDLLGESARTAKQAQDYFQAYMEAVPIIGASARDSRSTSFFDRPNLSVKMTALYPRVEWLQRDGVEAELLPILKHLTKLCAEHNVSLTFDAEEAKRLDIYLYIFTKLLEDREIRNHATIGIVVQAYQKRALPTIDYIIDMAKRWKVRIPIRLVKGAYWDGEIKRAQETGLDNYPVFTRKRVTDLSYLTCAERMLQATDHIIPQFATHNAVTAAAIMKYGKNMALYEFQKLHGMGDGLHKALLKRGAHSRIYAPVGQYHDLLAYLMRRLLENGANSSFVNQIGRKNMSLKDILSNPKDPVSTAQASVLGQNPRAIYPTRLVARGYEPGIRAHADYLSKNIEKWKKQFHEACSLINGEMIRTDDHRGIHPPADFKRVIGVIYNVDQDLLVRALEHAVNGYKIWSNVTVTERADCFYKAADVLEAEMSEFLHILIQEGGKTLHDAIAEVREAIDFCRYYADRACELMTLPEDLPGVTGESNQLSYHPRGVFLCISPWNFPLAIFLGQVVASLVSGNAVIAKAAEQTQAIAMKIMQLLHRVGVPVEAAQLVIAKGSLIGKVYVPDTRIAGICFTGSTETAQIIQKTLATRGGPITPFIAETGGQNVMIVDSSALLEQAADDIVLSAFGSAGQRCSALRILYIQEESYNPLLQLITGAAAELKIGNGEDFATDIGPVIDAASKKHLNAHIAKMQEKGAVLFCHKDKAKLDAMSGHFVVPHVIAINSMNDLPEEIFGPILHVIKYKANEFDAVIAEVNNSRYGLTFGLHTRLESRIKIAQDSVHVGNIYVNRSMIGAVVGSQPFGGERESGTGFKAGGPNYLLRFVTERTVTINKTAIGGNVDLIAQME